jgi:hypothetical protein
MWPNFGVQADGDMEAMSNADVLAATPGPYSMHADVRSSNVDPGSTDLHPMHPMLAYEFYDGAANAWMDQVGVIPEVAFGI